LEFNPKEYYPVYWNMNSEDSRTSDRLMKTDARVVAWREAQMDLSSMNGSEIVYA
jgi:hypothetical protein